MELALKNGLNNSNILFGEKEFNVYIYGNLTEEQKILLNKNHINPYNMDLRTFMDNF